MGKYSVKKGEDGKYKLIRKDMKQDKKPKSKDDMATEALAKRAKEC